MEVREQEITIANQDSTAKIEFPLKYEIMIHKLNPLKI